MSEEEEKGHIGSSFADFLDEEGIREEVEERAIKSLLARQLAAAMADQGLTKVEMAKRMKTSRQQLDRVLDPAGASVTLATLHRAAFAVGRKLRLELT